MPHSNPHSGLFRDLSAGLVVFLVALPLCLGVALASNAPLFSGVLAGIVGGLLVGAISGSQTSVSGPAAGLTAIVAAQIGKLGSFETFLLAVTLAGVIQIIMGVCRAGFIAAFFPSSVIKGLLAAIGVILILKQIPHVIGHDPDPEGDMAFEQPDHENTFTELWSAFFDIQPGAMLVGVLSIVLLVVWDKVKALKNSVVPAPLVVVLMGVLVGWVLEQVGGGWVIKASHLVQVPVAQDFGAFLGFLQFPNFGALNRPEVYAAAVTIAIVASLETLLNLEAVDKIDPEQRSSPPNRELLAQGVGNLVGGLIGALPMTSVIVRSSVNINAGAKSKLSAIFHGALLLGCVLLIPGWLNLIPLSALAAILLVTGLKLASPKLLKQMWSEGKGQFLPFAITVGAIVLTDLLVGILIGLAVSIGFILRSNMRRPLRKVMEHRVAGDVLRIELANQVSFFSRATLEKTLREVPRGGHVLIDARNTDYMDADILDIIQDFQNNGAKARGVRLSLSGFKDKYSRLEDRIQFMDYSSREVQSSLTPERVLEIFKEGNERFREGRQLTRDVGRLVDATSGGQFPMAVVLSCIDSRTPAELVFDLGLGDVFSVRIAGNIARDKVLGSMEYSCAVAGAKMILVMGHTSCGAVNAAVDLICSQKTAKEATGCVNLDSLVTEIQLSVDVTTCKRDGAWLPGEKDAYANEVSRRNVLRTMRMIRERSSTLDDLVKDGKLAIVGALYDVKTGHVSFFQTAGSSRSLLPIPEAVM
ncbi:SulP family inorganic anion transporter [Prosthecobacter sp.]|uniref:bifunctional SulP family inorganic anion transporter/carbonic anhydrase n=1 Tax=Prosthecobacter sp. TaxID=1965333 RepID=UPI001D2F297F|nr:SulP family inorganic anion transporter [Prosthecobacter sp.]MCB1278545.1 bifunctional SulP family inorganic anion transporter/carbonic anhydrase [Prosthecobacter sp.]